jgi:excisionase family DNA binding protein
MEPDLPSSENDVLTGDEAADFLGIPKSALLDLCRDGQLAGIKVGRHWRFQRDALEAWRDRDSTPPQPYLSEPPSEEAIPTPSQEPTTENDMKSTTLESLLKAEQLEHLLPIFEEQGVTDSILGELTDSDLRELGIDKFGERKRLLRVFNQPMESPTAPPGKPASKPKRTPSPQEDFTYDAANGEITITGYRGRGHVVIPDQFDDLPLPVRRIGDWAFKDNGMVLSVVIPMGVTAIGSYAFYGCSSMATVEMPGSVASIGMGAFQGCSSLPSLEIPDGVTDPNVLWLLKRGVIAGSNTKIILSKSHPSFVMDAASVIFDKKLNAILYSLIECINDYFIPNSVTSIGDYAFDSCTGLTSITIPNSVTSIGKGAFGYCEGLTSVTIPNSVTSIGEGAFGYCKGLTSVTVPNSVTSIGKLAFHGCTGLTSVTIPNSVTLIGDYAFHGCTGLTSVTIPNSVTSIGEGAFGYCEGLTSVTIPNSVTSIGHAAFDGCSGLPNTDKIYEQLEKNKLANQPKETKKKGWLWRRKIPVA